MTIAGDLQVLLYEELKSYGLGTTMEDMDELVRIVFEFMRDGETIGFLSNNMDERELSAYLNALILLERKIIPKPDSTRQFE